MLQHVALAFLRGLQARQKKIASSHRSKKKKMMMGAVVKPNDYAAGLV